jgi:mRNA-degrading endonuclease toxin of MazEF toxin-antitoxin module
MRISRGNVYQADLGRLPVPGQDISWEKAGIHPVVVVSINEFNSGRNLIVVVPGTGRIRNYATNVVVTPNECKGLRKDTSFECLQVRALPEQAPPADWPLAGRNNE